MSEFLKSIKFIQSENDILKAFNYKKDCKDLFIDINPLIDQGFERSDTLNDEMIKLFNNELPLIDIYFKGNLLFVKDFGAYKIMLVVAASIKNLNDMKNPYYIKAKILLDKNDRIVRTLDQYTPSIVFYKPENNTVNNCNMDAYCIFYKSYYIFVEIEDFDSYTNRYNYIFTSYNNHRLSIVSHPNHDIDNIPIKKYFFEINGIDYEPKVLLNFNSTLDIFNPSEILQYVAEMDSDNFKLLSMYII